MILIKSFNSYKLYVFLFINKLQFFYSLKSLSIQDKNNILISYILIIKIFI